VERRSKLLGLDAPQKIAQTDSMGQDANVPQRIRDMSDEEITARTRELQRMSADDMSEGELREMVEDMTRGRFTLALPSIRNINGVCRPDCLACLDR
jgi:hypothetical protein